MRTDDGGSLLLLPSHGLCTHGLTPTFAVGDEIHAWRENSGSMEALQTAVVKRPDSKLVLISSAGQATTRRSAACAREPSHCLLSNAALLRSRGDAMRALLWELADDADVDDSSVVKKANPASWIGEADLRRQRKAVPDLAFRRYHCGQWTQSRRLLAARSGLERLHRRPRHRGR
jgi:hypothetical protein